MTVPTHIKIVARGFWSVVGAHSSQLGEDWSCSFKFSDGHEDAGTVASAQDVDVEGIYGDWANWMLGFSLGSNCGIREISAYHIADTGRMDGNPNVFIKDGGSEAFGSVTPRYPLQVALVVTSVAANRGPARFGRFFLPAPQLAMDATMRLSVEDTQTILAGAVTLTKAMSDKVDLDLLRSAEMINVSTLQGGKQQTVDHLRVGRVLDTHRSRRTSLLEAYEDSGHIDW